MKKTKRFPTLFLGMFVVPFAAVLGYYGLMAEPRFETEARVALKSTSSESSASPLVPLLGGSEDRVDELYLIGRVYSRDVAERVDKHTGIRSQWDSDKGTDFMHRLWGKKAAEDFVELYRRNVNLRVDPVSKDLVLTVRTFEADQAQKIAQFLVEDLKEFTNEASRQVAREQIEFAENEVAARLERLKAIKTAMLDYQTQHRLVDAEVEARAKLEAVTRLESVLSTAEADLMAAKAYLSNDSHEVKALAQKAVALRTQVGTERARLTQGDARQIDKVAHFQDLKASVALAEERYRRALDTLDTVRVNAARQAKTLTVIAAPLRAERALYPKYAREIAMAALVLLAVYGFVKLTRTLVREHRS